MNNKICTFVLGLFFCSITALAQESDIKAFETQIQQGQIRSGVEYAIKATTSYYTRSQYKEAFELLRRTDQAISSNRTISAKEKAALRYLTTKERMQMYIKLRKSASAMDQLSTMERYTNESGDETLKNDLLYCKTIYYYTFGQTSQGDAVFKQMATKLTAHKEYDKVDEAYKTLIANGRRSNNASMVAQTYNSYIAWKDSIDALKVADEIGALKEQIATGEATIAEKDSSLSTRKLIIIGLCIFTVALIALLVVGSVILLRYIILANKQKKTIKLANENNALKAKFISNISSQLEPTLKKLNGQQPEVNALLRFSGHIQTLSDLENTIDEPFETEDILVPKFCEEIVNQIRDKVRSGVTLTVNAPKMSVAINKEYVSHILLHLLSNAAEFTPENGHITLDYKKRGVHKHQFIVSDTGAGIPEEKHEDIFKPFTEIRDLTNGDGLGLPICKQMAIKMKGDLEIDPQFTKGTRFVLDLYV